MRSERRHHRERLKKSRAGFWAGYASQRAGRVIDTPRPCSCWLCRNDDPTRQQLRADAAWRKIEQV